MIVQPGLLMLMENQGILSNYCFSEEQGNSWLDCSDQGESSLLSIRISSAMNRR